MIAILRTHVIPLISRIVEALLSIIGCLIGAFWIKMGLFLTDTLFALISSNSQLTQSLSGFIGIAMFIMFAAGSWMQGMWMVFTSLLGLFSAITGWRHRRPDHLNPS